MVAMLFIIFDIEIVFMYPWALNFKDEIARGNGKYMLVIMAVFFVLLTLGLIYELSKGVLNWADKQND